MISALNRKNEPKIVKKTQKNETKLSFIISYMPPIEKLLYTIFSCFSSALSGIVKKKWFQLSITRTSLKSLKNAKKRNKSCNILHSFPHAIDWKIRSSLFIAIFYKLFQESSRKFWYQLSIARTSQFASILRKIVKNRAEARRIHTKAYGN